MFSKSLKSKKGIIVLFIVAILLLVGINIGNRYKYKENLKKVSVDMLNLGAEGESMINTYTSVWKESISRNLYRRDIARAIGLDEEYFMKNTPYPGDGYQENTEKLAVYKGGFERAIKYVNLFYLNTGKNGEINNRLLILEKEIKLLNNPPRKYKNEYDMVINMYDSLKQIVAYSTSPSGSLSSYSSDTKGFIDVFLTNYNKIKIKLDIA